MVKRLTNLGEKVDPGASDTEVHQHLIRALSERIQAATDGEDDRAVEVLEESLDEVLDVEPPEGRTAELVPRAEPRPQLPNAAIWAHLATMAEPLARSNLVKPALRGKPNDVLMVLLTGYDLGITATQALSKVHIIEGQPSASPELILGLIRREGHRAWPGGPDHSGIVQESEDVRTLEAVVHAVRRDDPERVITSRYNIAQAEQAGLVKVENGKLRARSRDGKALPWENYPEDLLWARAVSRLGRRNFSDVLLGLSYVPEELGFIDVQSTPVTVPPVDEDPEMQPSRLSDFRARIERLPDPIKNDLALQWKHLMENRALHSLDTLRDREWEAANDLITNYERRARDEAALGKAAEMAMDSAPPCEQDVVATLEDAMGATVVEEQAETGLPFPCQDFAQPGAVKVCPTGPQCAEAGMCLRDAI
jgi:hypothetical protein